MPAIAPVRAEQGKLLRAEPIAQQVVQDKVRFRGVFTDLEREWATWQPTDPDSPGRIDASCILVDGLVPEASQGVIVHAPLPTAPQPGGQSGGRPSSAASAYGRRIGWRAIREVELCQPLRSWWHKGGRVTSETQRHVRLRLARRRTAPARVRARIRVQDDQQEPVPAPQPEPEPAPEGEPEPGKPWWKRIPWVHVGTVVGALAAIGGLTFTGIATYYGAAVSRDQLDQAREDAQREAREQAMRVTYWVEQKPVKGTVILHFANRSPDPVTDLLIKYSGPGVTTEPSDFGGIIVTAVAPCTELTWALQRGADGLALGSSMVKWARFTDRDGKTWARTSSGLKETDEQGFGGGSFLYPGDPETATKTPVCAEN
ncbi:hypothetical protein ACIBU0_35895 [Streptomyces sp. NPDC049627]|uniref:hypothetical protein n=1 Tax=Streptomyces sp. NPDC049627 TaxID=3365595 RepID=UPI00378FD9CB